MTGRLASSAFSARRAVDLAVEVSDESGIVRRDSFEFLATEVEGERSTSLSDEAVADILVKKYGISRDRLKIDWKGDTVQPYNENVWNRIVLMSAE